MGLASQASLLSFILGLSLFTGCASIRPLGASPCANGASVLVKDTLYFGRNRPSGGSVTDAEWIQFVDEVVTPQFPSGLTIVEASGQWRGNNGLVEREKSEVVTLLHAGNEESDRKVDQVAEEYKTRFQQEAVLRERVLACTWF